MAGLFRHALVLGLVASCAASARADDAQHVVAAPAGTIVLQAHAEGAQVYECKADAGGKLGWQLREPVATLLEAGKTVGRHFAGPSWELADGSLVIGKVTARAAGATSKDIPWLKLDVVEHHGDGALDNVTTVQRIDTAGGAVVGPCPVAGAFHAEPYSADYVFSRP